MEPSGRHDIFAEIGGVIATLVDDPGDGERAIRFLDRLERGAEAPLVDESERARLRALAVADESDAHWHAVLARRASDGEPVGYAGVLVPGEDDEGVATGDLAFDRAAPAELRLSSALGAVVTRVAGGHGADRLELWIRDVTEPDVAPLLEGGFSVDRVLEVLGRPLDRVEEPELPAGVDVRGFREDDADGVVAVLADAYRGTDEAGWDRARFEERRAYPWFDPADLLVADTDGEVAAVHWTKRRGQGVGEVYNLAVHPDHQGRGLGAGMLLAGLRHLAGRDCDQVILWVDRGNDRGLALYHRHGFVRRWLDVALSRPL